jgi:hypothetical protein
MVPRRTVPSDVSRVIRAAKEALNLIEVACKGLLAGFVAEFKEAKSG